MPSTSHSSRPPPCPATPTFTCLQPRPAQLTPRTSNREVRRTAMGEHVRITPDGRVVIDSGAWIGRRVRGRDRTWPPTCTPGSTASRHDNNAPLDDETVTDWASLTQAWCTARGHDVREPGLIMHEQTRLDTRLWVLLPEAADSDRVAVVAIDDEPPTVYADDTSEAWVWCDADSVVITCPAGHSWTWRAGRALLTATGRPATLTTVFGPNLDAPF